MRDALRFAIEKLPRPIRMRAANAFEGFDRARLLLPIDREMASFRAITSEEEAAAALFLSLQLRKYPGAEQLNLHSHPHKAAVAPFLEAVKQAMLTGRKNLNIKMILDFSEPSIRIGLPLEELGILVSNPEAFCLQPVEPLGILGAKEDGTSPTSFFDEHIASVTSAETANDVRKFIQREANVRNTLLYASDDAVPKSKATEGTIEMRQKRAETALLLTIAILQVKTHQAMALQCLAAFLKMIGKALETDPDYPKIEPDFVIRMVKRE